MGRPRTRPSLNTLDNASTANRGGPEATTPGSDVIANPARAPPSSATNTPVPTLIRDVFPARTVTMSVSVVISGMGLVAIPAPFLARWLIDSTGFRSLSWFTLICLAVLAPMILLTTAESNLRLHSRLDLVGAVLLGAGIGGVLVGISFGPD